MRNIRDKNLKTPLPLDLFAKTFHYPPAMVWLTIECGLEAPEGRVTGVAFCRWLTAHYNDFRKAAGLPELAAPTELMSAEKRAQITMGNVLRTHADYFASRTSSLEHKEEWMNLSNNLGSYSNT